jgi:dihydrofolate reductase
MINTFIIVATSADGFIARDPKEPSTNWTSKEDKAHFIETTKNAGAIVMGLNTFKTIGKALPGRRNIVYSEETINVPNIETTNLPPEKLIEKLDKEGVKNLAICGGATIYTMFLKSGLIKKIYLTIEPIIFGSGIKLFNEPIEQKFKLINSEQKENTVFLEYEII